MAESQPRLLTRAFGCALAFSCGIGLARLGSLPSWPPLVLCLLAFAALVVLHRNRGGPRSRARSALIPACLVLTFAGAGATRASQAHDRFLSAGLLHIFSLRGADAGPILVRGWVADDPTFREERTRFILRIEKTSSKGRWLASAGTARVTVRDPERKLRLRFGDRLELPLRLREARNFRNPGAFDYRRLLEADGIHLLGSCKSPVLVARRKGRRGGSIRALAHALRGALMARLEAGFPGASGEEPRRFLGAILLGARDGGEGDLDRVFRRTGVYHILSISGLHFALLMSFLHRLARRCRLGEPLQAVVMGSVGGFYVLLSGGEDPILRCGLAGLAHGGGSLTGRRISACDAQAMAATALLALRPLHLFQPAFQLSFLVTYGVLCGARPWWPRLRSVPFAGDALAVSSSAWVASTPVMATLFLQVSPIAVVLNLLAAPFLAVSLAMGVGILFFPCRGLERAFAVCFHEFGSICAGSMALPGAFLRVPAPGFPLLSGLTALVLVRLSLPCSPARREFRLLSGSALLGLLLVCVPPPPLSPASSLSLTVLDVGQGDSLLVGFPGDRWALIDAGGFAGSEFDVGERVVLPALLAMGVRRLDLLVLTHAHQDHGGGIPALVEALPIGEIWIGRDPPGSRLVERIVKLAKERRIPVFHPMRGSLRCMSGACLEVLHPPPGYRRGLPAANDDSLVLRVTHLGSSMLLTGDVESEGEALLLDPVVPLSAQLLKVPHHGSDSSSSFRFLRRVSPRAAIISVGTGNPWGHPSGRVLERFQALGIRTERTDRDGAIRYVASGSAWRKEPLPK